jgi:hypothetical protein
MAERKALRVDQRLINIQLSRIADPFGHVQYKHHKKAEEGKKHTKKVEKKQPKKETAKAKRGIKEKKEVKPSGKKRMINPSNK